MKTHKKCYICKDVKVMSEFYKNRSSPDGYTYSCKPCDKAKSSAYQRRTGYNKKPHRLNKGNPSRQAKSAVKWAVQIGKLPHISTHDCEDCGSQAQNYHHESYERDKWLDVTPLCTGCHSQRHQVMA